MPAPKLHGLAHLVIRVRGIHRSLAFHHDVIELGRLSTNRCVHFINSPRAAARPALVSVDPGAGAGSVRMASQKL